MTSTPRKRSKPRITAAQRVEMYGRSAYGSAWTHLGRDRGLLLKMLRDHARETLARERRRNGDRFVLKHWRHPDTVVELGQMFNLGDGWMKVVRERRRNRAGT